MKSSWLFIYPLPLFSLQIQTRFLSFSLNAGKFANISSGNRHWMGEDEDWSADMFFWHLPTQRDISRKVKRRVTKAIHFAPQNLASVSLDLWNNCGRIKFSENENKSHWFTKLLSREVLGGKFESTWDPTQITRGSVKTPRFHSIILSVQLNDVEKTLELIEMAFFRGVTAVRLWDSPEARLQMALKFLELSKPIMPCSGQRNQICLTQLRFRPRHGFGSIQSIRHLQEI